MNHKNKVHKEFEGRVKSWIYNMEGEHKFYAKTLTTHTHKEVLDNIFFNVMAAYRDLIQYPERCPECTRSGNDHDSECSLEGISYDDLLRKAGK